MSWLDTFQDEEKKESGTVEGVAIAIVTNNKDPQNWGRVKLKYPWREDQQETEWVRVASLAAGQDRGTLWVPEVKDEVLVAFEKGNVDHPFVLGALWNGQDKPPAKNDDGKNNTKLIKTRSGHEVRFFDKEQEEFVEVKTHGGHTFRLDDKAGDAQVQIKDSSGSNKITIKTTGNSIEIESGLTLKIKSQTISIEAGASMTLKASGTLTIQGALVKIN
jgi:uncharacterized protein involved in type VI secretion and phage assembly